MPGYLETTLREVPLLALLESLATDNRRARLTLYDEKRVGVLHLYGAYVTRALHNQPYRLRIGDILCQMGLCSPDAVERAYIKQQADVMVERPIGEYLLETSDITAEGLHIALIAQTAETALQLLDWENDDLHVKVEFVGTRQSSGVRISLDTLLEERQRRAEETLQLEAMLVGRGRIPAWNEAFDWAPGWQSVARDILPKDLPLLRSVLPEHYTLRQTANRLGVPEHALAHAMVRALSRSYAIRVPVRNGSGGTISGRDLLDLIASWEATWQQDIIAQSRVKPMQVLKVLCGFVRQVFAYYESNGFVQVANRDILKVALNAVITGTALTASGGKLGEYWRQKAALLDIRGDGVVGLEAAEMAIGLLRSSEARRHLLKTLYYASLTLVEVVLRACIKQTDDQIAREDVSARWRSLCRKMDPVALAAQTMAN